MNSFPYMQKTIRIDEINLNAIDRGRVDLGDIDEMCRSIEEVGQITPIAVQSITGEAPYNLLAGMRRTLATQKLGYTVIMARIYQCELTEYTMRLIELMENIVRKDLTPIESSLMTKKIDDLFKQMHGPKIGRSADAPGHSLRDTAKILNRSPSSVSMDLKIAEFHEKFPNLKLNEMKNKATIVKFLDSAAKNVGIRTTAENLPKIVEQRVSNNELNSSQIGALKVIDKYILGDFFENNLPDNSFTFAEVDPVYGIDLLETKLGENTLATPEYEDIERSEYPKFLAKLTKELYRLVAPSGWVAVWTTWDYMAILFEQLKVAGFLPSRTPAIWVKGTVPGQSRAPEVNLGSAAEMFVYARKGSGRLAKPGRSNIFNYTPVPPNQKIHMTGKPVDLMDDIISTFVPGINGRILVPFAGSGVTLWSAFRRGIESIGYDISRVSRDAFVAHMNMLYKLTGGQPTNEVMVQEELPLELSEEELDQYVESLRESGVDI